MLNRTISLYKNAYSGLSPETWWLSITMLINRSGTMVIPFLTIYLTSPKMGYSISQAGVVMGLFGLGAVVGAYISGKLTDKIGFYPIQLFTLFFGGILFIVLGYLTSYVWICAGTFVLSMVNEAFRPANSTAIAFYSKEGNRTRSYALNRLSINLGWAVGNAIGGLLASIDYHLLFWVDGITNMLAAVFMFIVLKPEKGGKAPEKTTATSNDHSAYKDRIYIMFVVLVTLFAACFFQLFTNLTAYFRNELHFSERFIGLLGAINGILIALIEMVIVFRIEGKKQNTYYIVRGVFLCGLAYMMLVLLPFEMKWVAVFMILMITAGEIFSMPFMNSFWISRTSLYNRGQYAALYTVAWATAQTLGPLLGAQVAAFAGFTTLWWLVAAGFFISTIGFLLLHKRSLPPI